MTTTTYHEFMCLVNEVYEELIRAEEMHPNYPEDPVRRAGILVEEVGETMTASLDLTRVGTPKTKETIIEMRERVRDETIQAAAMAIRLLIAMRREDYDAKSATK